MTPRPRGAFALFLVGLMSSLGCVEQSADVLRLVEPDLGTVPDLKFVEMERPLDPPQACGPPSFRWLNPLPQGFDLKAAWGSSDDDVWMVGVGGTIFHYDGQKLSQIKSPTAVTLTAVWGSGPRDIWISGEKGVLLHGDGGCFTIVNTGTEIPLRTVFGSGPQDVWAAGDKGTLLHFDGHAWYPLDSVGSGQLVAGWASAPDDVWIVDQKPSSVLRYDGKRLTRTPLSGTIHGIHGSGPSDVWFVGANGSNAQTWRYDGVSYSQVPISGNPLFGVWARSPQDVWAAGSGGMILHYDGKVWSNAPGTKWDPQLNFNAVWPGRNKEPWLVGAKGYIGRVGSSALAPLSQDMAPDSRLIGMWASSATDLWVLSTTGAVLHWDGNSTAKIEIGSKDELAAIWGSSASDIWVVGRTTSNAGVVWHWDGTRFSSVPIGAVQPLTAVWGSAANDVWIAGQLGVLLHWDGSKMDSVATGTTYHFMALSGTGRNALWAMRGDGKILRYDGTSWTPLPDPMTGRFAWVTFWVGGPDDIWLGGQAGIFTHFDGTTWKSTGDLTGVGGSIVSIWGSAPNNVWATMTHAQDDPSREVLIHYDGTKWSPAGLGMVMRSQSVYGRGDSLWVAGNSVTLMHGNALIQIK